MTWIRAEMDRIGLNLPEPEQARVAGLFRQMSKLEVAFFEAAWTGKVPGPEDDLLRT